MKLSRSPRPRLESQRHKIRRDKSKTGMKRTPSHVRACQYPSNQIADLRGDTPRGALPYADTNKTSPDLSTFDEEITKPSDFQSQKSKAQISDEDTIVLLGDESMDAEESCVFASGAKEMRDCFMKLLQLVPMEDSAENIHEPSMTSRPLSPVPPALSPGGKRISKLQLLQGAIDYILDLESTLENRMGSLGGCCNQIGPLVFPLANEERGLAPVLDSDLAIQVWS